jgi:hypothetical protein
MKPQKYDLSAMLGQDSEGLSHFLFLMRSHVWIMCERVSRHTFIQHLGLNISKLESYVCLSALESYLSNPNSRV